jgi:flagellin-like protein
LTKNISRDKRALSPVIATVILVSVTIVVAVSVAYWMGAIASGYTSFEQIELPTIFPTKTGSGWNVTIQLRNSGSADATLTNVFVNDVPLSIYPSGLVALYNSTLEPQQLSSIRIPIPKGNTVTVYLGLVQNTTYGFTAGTTLSIKLHTAAGRDYPTSVRLT